MDNKSLIGLGIYCIFAGGMLLAYMRFTEKLLKEVD